MIIRTASNSQSVLIVLTQDYSTTNLHTHTHTHLQGPVSLALEHLVSSFPAVHTRPALARYMIISTLLITGERGYADLVLQGQVDLSESGLRFSGF